MNTATVQPGSAFDRLVESRRTLLACAAVVALPILTLLLRLFFWPYLPGYPFVAFIPSVAFVALIGGVPLALATAVVSALLALVYLAEPSGLIPATHHLWVGLFFYSIVCATLIALARRAATATALAVKAAAAQVAARESALQAQMEITRAAAARSQAERRLEQVTDALPVLISQVGPDLRYQFVNRAYEDWFGRTRDELMGRSLEEVAGPEVFALARPHILAVLSGRPASFEASIPHVSGRVHIVQAHYVPNFGPDGEVEGYFTLVQDITEAKRQADLLAQRERHLRAVMESVTDCFYAVDRDWHITLFNRAAERYYGIAREVVLGRKLWDAFPAHVGSVFEQQLQRVMDERVPVTFEAQSVVFPDRFIEMRVSPKEGSGLAVSFSDISSRKAEEHQRELLIHELNHRVKNTLAVVQSIAAQTFRDPQVPQKVRVAFEGRLMALAAAHDLLTSENWEATQLRTAVAAALRPFSVEHRFDVSGPDLRIKPQAAVNLTLALHELATNASKYGALSNESGTISVRWTLSQEESNLITLVWQEQGGPEVVPPTRRGFGSRLIRHGLARDVNGTVTLDFLPEGLVCKVEALVENLVAR